jgi:hypothetical protein
VCVPRTPQSADVSHGAQRCVSLPAAQDIRRQERALVLERSYCRKSVQCVRFLRVLVQLSSVGAKQRNTLQASYQTETASKCFKVRKGTLKAALSVLSELMS